MLKWFKKTKSILGWKTKEEKGRSWANTIRLAYQDLFQVSGETQLCNLGEKQIRRLRSASDRDLLFLLKSCSCSCLSTNAHYFSCVVSSGSWWGTAASAGWLLDAWLWLIRQAPHTAFLSYSLHHGLALSRLQLDLS